MFTLYKVAYMKMLALASGFILECSIVGLPQITANKRLLIYSLLEHEIYTGLFLEWILQNKAGHLMMSTQHSILNHDSADIHVDKNKAEN